MGLVGRPAGHWFLAKGNDAEFRVQECYLIKETGIVDTVLPPLPVDMEVAEHPVSGPDQGA